MKKQDFEQRSSSPSSPSKKGPAPLTFLKKIGSAIIRTPTSPVFKEAPRLTPSTEPGAIEKTSSIDDIEILKKVLFLLTCEPIATDSNENPLTLSKLIRLLYADLKQILGRQRLMLTIALAKLEISLIESEKLLTQIRRQEQQCKSLFQQLLETSEAAEDYTSIKLNYAEARALLKKLYKDYERVSSSQYFPSIVNFNYFKLSLGKHTMVHELIYLEIPSWLIHLIMHYLVNDKPKSLVQESEQLKSDLLLEKQKLFTREYQELNKKINALMSNSERNIEEIWKLEILMCQMEYALLNIEAVRKSLQVEGADRYKQYNSALNLVSLFYNEISYLFEPHNTTNIAEILTDYRINRLYDYYLGSRGITGQLAGSIQGTFDSFIRQIGIDAFVPEDDEMLSKLSDEQLAALLLDRILKLTPSLVSLEDTLQMIKYDMLRVSSDKRGSLNRQVTPLRLSLQYGSSIFSSSQRKSMSDIKSITLNAVDESRNVFNSSEIKLFEMTLAGSESLDNQKRKSMSDIVASTDDLVKLQDIIDQELEKHHALEQLKTKPITFLILVNNTRTILHNTTSLLANFMSLKNDSSYEDSLMNFTIALGKLNYLVDKAEKMIDSQTYLSPEPYF